MQLMFTSTCYSHNVTRFSYLQTSSHMQSRVHGIPKPASIEGLLTPLAGQLPTSSSIDRHVEQQLEHTQQFQHRKSALRRLEQSPERRGGRTPYQVNPLAQFRNLPPDHSPHKSQRSAPARSPPRAVAHSHAPASRPAHPYARHMTPRAFNPFVQPHSNHVWQTPQARKRPGSYRVARRHAYGQQAAASTDRWQQVLRRIRRDVIESENVSDEDRRFRVEAVLDEHVAFSSGLQAPQLLQLIQLLRSGPACVQVCTCHC